MGDEVIIFNAIFYGFLSAVLGGLFTKSGTTENAVPRWISLLAGFIVLAWNVHPNLIALGAWVAAFYVIRIQSTRPLLDATYPDYNNWWHGIRRNLWLIPLAPFTSWWLLVLIPQVAIYYGCAWVVRRFGLRVNAVRVSEAITGALYGAMI